MKIRNFQDWSIDEKRKTKNSPEWHDSDAPDANGKFKELGIRDLAKWLISTRKGDMRKITGSLNQQIVFNRNDDPAYARKMEKVREEVKRQLKKESVEVSESAMFSSKYDVKKELPDGGIMRINNTDELEALADYFIERDYREGYSNDTTYDWLKRNWEEWVKGKDFLVFQWAKRHPHIEGSYNAFFTYISDEKELKMEIEGCPVLNFEDYFKPKKEYSGYFKGKNFGI